VVRHLLLGTTAGSKSSVLREDTGKPPCGGKAKSSAPGRGVTSSTENSLFTMGSKRDVLFFFSPLQYQAEQRELEAHEARGERRELTS